MTAPPPLEHCVRHPGTVTGRHCTRCSRPACNECLVPASVGSHCLDCIRASRPSRAERARRRRATGHDAPLTRAIVIANAATYLWVAGGSGAVREMRIGLAGYYVAQGEWWRLVTSGFLHFGILHLAMNMLLCHQLGSLLEPALGRGRFALLYAAALTGGATGALLLSPGALTGGASGAVFGLMGAAAAALRHRGINPMHTGIGTTLVLNLLITFAVPGISIGGHIGGVLTGAAVGHVMFNPIVDDRVRWASWAAPVAAIIGCLAWTAQIV